MKQCKECGVFSQDDEVFCYVCGRKFPELPNAAIEMSQQETKYSYSEQVMDNQVFTGCYTRFMAPIYVCTRDEGGRHTPFFNRYRPQFRFGTTDVTGIISYLRG